MMSKANDMILPEVANSILLFPCHFLPALYKYLLNILFYVTHSRFWVLFWSYWRHYRYCPFPSQSSKSLFQRFAPVCSFQCHNSFLRHRMYIVKSNNPESNSMLSVLTALSWQPPILGVQGYIWRPHVHFTTPNMFWTFDSKSMLGARDMLGSQFHRSPLLIRIVRGTLYRTDSFT